MLAPVGCPVKRSLDHHVKLDLLLQNMARDSLGHRFIQGLQVSHSPMSKRIVVPHDPSFLVPMEQQESHRSP